MMAGPFESSIIAIMAALARKSCDAELVEERRVSWRGRKSFQRLFSDASYRVFKQRSGAKAIDYAVD